MNIIVCIKSVPVSDSIINITSEGRRIDTTNLKFDLNPYDEYALEAAVQLKEQLGGNVTALSLGPESHALGLKRALALGANNLIQLTADEETLSDALATAQILAETIKGLPYDLILCGKQSIDSGNATTGRALAQLLNLPCVTAVVSLTIEDNRAIVAREFDGQRAVYECQLPCVLTAEKGLNKPRYPSLKDIMAARNKPTSLQKPLQTETATAIIGYQHPAPRQAGKIIDNNPGAVPELLRFLKESAGII